MVAAHTDEISDILKSKIFHTDTATVSNFTSIYTEIHEKSQPSLESFFFIFKRLDNWLKSLLATLICK